MNDVHWVRPNEALRTNEAIIRSFPGRVLTITVLASHKRPFSFDSCVPSADCKRARISAPSSPPSRRELAVVDVVKRTNSQTACTIAALLAVGHGPEPHIPVGSLFHSASSVSIDGRVEPGDFPLLSSDHSVEEAQLVPDEN